MITRRLIPILLAVSGIAVFITVGILITNGRLSPNTLKPVANQPGMALPSLSGASEWFNTTNNSPLSPADLEGKVVLVDFWTYSCINCIRTLPYLTEWHKKYADKGLVIIGVHTPEFAFEKVPENVADALKKHGINYPVALDPNFSIWNTFNNRYWPAKYLFAADGTLAYTHFGEGEYPQTELEIQRLLMARGEAIDMDVVATGAGPDFRRIGSPETYLGYVRGERFNQEIKTDIDTTYVIPNNPAINQASFGGRWRVEHESARVVEQNASLTYRFLASAVHLVMGSTNGAIRVRVTLNGAPIPPPARPAEMREINGETILMVNGKDLYTLIDQKGIYKEGLLQIEFLDAGADVFAFTFG